MRDKIYLVVMVILGFIAALLVVWVALTLSSPRKVECDVAPSIPNSSDYKPKPKQCEKGE